LLIINPKRINESIEIKPYWYNYYAGYSHTFTKGIIDSSNLQKNAIILDPWNGAGTTTLMASVSGFRSIGVDLNPVMKIIALAKQVTISDANIVEEKIKKIKSSIAIVLDDEDPLFVWFDKSSVESIRKIEKVILGGNVFKTTLDKVDSINPSQGLMYTALFNCVREYLKPFVPSNPTWIKKPKDENEKVLIIWNSFKERYKDLIREMIEGVKVVEHIWSSDLSTLVFGSSSNLQLEDCSIDLVLTSPPYCTRIDYGVATLPELSIISVNGKDEIDTVRRSLMGTTTVPKTIRPLSPDYGKECLYFLDCVESHQSKASKTYYYKNFVQYFKALNKVDPEVQTKILLV